MDKKKENRKLHSDGPGLTLEQYRQMETDGPYVPTAVKPCEESKRATPATLRDCIYGLAVGDALGVPYEFKPRGSFECVGMVGHGTHGKPAGTWSDDTSMTLATCDSIRKLGRIDIDDIRHRFEDWLFKGVYTVDGVFDYGGTTARAITEGRGCAGERDNGNGSLMRIAPLAFLAGVSDDGIEAVSAITHAHRTSTSACVEFVHVLREVAAGVRLPIEDELHAVPESSIRSGGYVLDTYRAALWCLAGTDSYEECVLRAVNLGNDTDTTAAVAGALAGARYGFDSIPSEWIEALRGKETIEAYLF